MKYPPYPRYKDSGVECFQSVPNHWEVERIDRLFVQRNEEPLPDDKLVSAFITGEVTLRENKADNIIKSSGQEVGYKRIHSGDLVISGMNAHLGGLGISDSDGKCSPVYLVLKPMTEIEGKFFSYQLRHMAQSQFIRSLVNTIRFNSSDFKSADLKLLNVLFPPLEEQQAVANFLDRETAKTDALIAKQEWLIELLQEKRQSIISHAVTKGLNPEAPMKNSGIEWIGEIPAHWEFIRLKHALSWIEQGWSPDCENRIAEEGEWGVLKAGCVNRGIFNEKDHKTLPKIIEPTREYEVVVGDILMSRASGSPDLVGSAAYVHKCRSKLLLSDKTFRLHRKESVIDGQYLAAVLNSRGIRIQIERAISGAEGLANNITQGTIRNLYLNLPPREEQPLILEHITNETTKVDALIEKTQRAIDLLKEHRSALISAAVTGMIDVRQFVD